MPTLTPPTDNPLHGILRHGPGGFLVVSEFATSPPYPFCEQGAVASVRAHAAYIRAVANHMEDFATGIGFDTTDWVEMDEDPQSTPNVAMNQDNFPRREWSWAVERMKEGKKVTRAIYGLNWCYFMDKSGVIQISVKGCVDEPAHVDNDDFNAVDWCIYEGTT